MITADEVREIISEYDAKSPRSGLDYYVAFMKIVLKNEGIDLVHWDEFYRDEDRRKAFEKANAVIDSVLQSPTPEGPGFKDAV